MMSVAIEFAPVAHVPLRCRPQSSGDAAVLPLYRPSSSAVATPVRLTRRGVVVLAVAVAVLAAALLSLARVSAPSDANDGRAPLSRPATVTVIAGDTLWSIASRLAPDRDPRAEVADLQRLNGLAGVALSAGQVLRTG
jgi:Tfp pilus assembly protein FimV